MVGRGWIYACLCLSLTAMPAAWALQWQVDPTMSLSTDYSDNRFLTSENPESMAYSSLNLGLQAKRKTESDSIVFTPALRLSRYSSRSEYDNNVYSARIDFDHVAVRSHWNLITALTRDTTLATAYEATGLVDQKLDRQLLSFRPSYDRSVTDRLSVTVGLDLNRVNYDNTTGTLLAEYNNETVSLMANYALQQKSRLQVSAAVTSLDLIGVDYRNRDYSLNLGYVRKYSAVLEGDFSIGGHHSTVDGTRLGMNYSDSKNGWLAAANIRRQLMAGNASFAIKRSVESSAYGGLLQKDEVSLALMRNLKERLHGVITLRLYKTESLADINVDNRDFASLDARLNWRYSPDLTISAGYNRLYNNFRDQAGHADANVISVRIAYTGDFRAYGP